MLARTSRFPRSLVSWLALMAASVASGSSVPANPAIADLRTCSNALLQTGLEDALGRLGLAPAVADGRLSIALVDLSREDTPRLAMVNGDEMMYAASLPKIAILLGAFVQAERGELELDEDTLASLNRMIRHSSNQDANAMLARVGEETLIEILTSSRYRFYDPANGGGLWVGKHYAKAPAYHRDPIHGLSHGATAFQVARFYYLLDRGQLVSAGLTREMKAALVDPAIHHKFVKGLESRPDRRLYRLYRKSGTWKQFHSDSALVEGRSSRYILVGLARDAHGGEWLERIAGPLDDLIQKQSIRP